MGGKKPMLDEKECFGKLTPAFAKCLYLNPSMRSSSGKARKEVHQKINNSKKSKIKMDGKETWL